MIQLPDHYTSIDYMPMLNWDRINKKNDMSYLLLKTAKLTVDQNVELTKVWDLLKSEYIEVFGLGEHFKDIINLEMKIARLKLKKIIQNDASIENFIKVNEKLLIELKNKKQEGDIYKTKQAMEKYFGIQISLITCPVREFYEYLEDFKKNGIKKN